MKRTKQTKRIQPFFLVFILLFAFLLCSCRQGISQSPEQTEEQIQKREMPTTEESKLIEEYQLLHEPLLFFGLEMMAYNGLQVEVCDLKILSRIKKLQVELEGGAQECGGIRKQLFINAKMKSGKSISIPISSPAMDTA